MSGFSFGQVVVTRIKRGFNSIGIITSKVGSVSNNPVSIPDNNILYQVLIIAYFTDDASEIFTSLPDIKPECVAFDKKPFPWYEEIKSNNFLSIGLLDEEINLANALHQSSINRYASIKLELIDIRKTLFGFNNQQEIILSIINSINLYNLVRVIRTELLELEEKLGNKCNSDEENEKLRMEIKSKQTQKGIRKNVMDNLIEEDTHKKIILKFLSELDKYSI